MKAAAPIKAAFATAALALVAVACEDDATPTKLADEPRETTETPNPWTTIFAATESQGGLVQIIFAGSDRFYRIHQLDEGATLTQDGPEGAASLCAVEDATNRHELDAFRLCMARALRNDACSNGGVFVLYHPAHAPGSWRAACPVPQEADDDPDDDGARVNPPDQRPRDGERRA